MLEEILVNQRLNPRVIARMLSGLTYEEEHSEPADRLLAGRISHLVKFDARISSRRRILTFVGPSGSGKTTIIAKLAARFREAFQLRPGFVSVEGLKTSNAFHLQTFAALMEMPCIRVDRHSFRAGNVRYTQALEQLDDCDVVFVDSDGHTSVPLVREEESEVVMVLPAPWSKEELIATARRYAGSRFERLIISKMDRCGFAGPLVEALFELEAPLAFFSCGPRVPQDIEPASARRLAKMLTQILH